MQPARPQLGGGRAPGSFAPLPRNDPSQGNNTFNGSTNASATSSNNISSANSSNTRIQGDPQSFYSSNSNAAAAAAAAASADLPPPQRPRVRRVESSSSEDSISIHIAKARSPTSQYNPQFPQQAPSPGSSTPSYSQFTTAHSNSSAASLQNFSRPTPSPLANAAAAAVAARSVAGSHDPQLRNASPLTLPPSTASNTGMSRPLGHSRKHSQNAGVFEPSLPSISTSNLSSYGGMSQQSPSQRDLPASHIAAQAAVLSHQQSQQMLQHSRQRSQTVPTPGDHYEAPQPTGKRGSGQLNPPVLSLTEASAPRETGFGSQGYHNGLLGSNAATTAANVVFPRSGQTSPISNQLPPQPPPPPPPLPEKKPEKSSKVKLFSRPGKIGTKGESKDKPLPSPSKIGSALSALQRANFSTTSLDSTSQSFYNMANASSATIRPADPPTEKEAKEKKHHFLSRQRIKPSKDKDDYHLQLSSAASNSRPTDPSAPSSFYNFNVPSSPGPNSSAFNSGTFKNISGLDLRYGGRALRHGRKEEKAAEVNESISNPNDWAGPGSLGSMNAHPMYQEPIDSAKYGLNSMSMDDAWPYLRAKLLVIFEAEELKLPIEDFNRVVVLHLQYCIQRRSPNMVLEDLRGLLQTGFLSLDRNLLRGAEDRLIPALVDAWMAVFTHITPYLQAIFLPLDQEFAGNGTLMTPEQARDFWGGVMASSPAADGNINLAPASAVLDIRTLVLTSFRDVVILPRYEKLKTMFSRLSLEFLPGMALASPMQADTFGSTSPGAESAPGLPYMPQQRPGTAMSLDPSTASYNSTSTTLLGDLAAGGRSRGLSNVSFASSGAHSNGGSDSLNMSSAHSLRPPKLTPGTSSLSLSGGGGPGPGSSSTSLLGLSLREQNIEDSKQVTEMVGRMLQCMSVLAGTGQGGDEGTTMVQELSRLLKLNWLGRGRTGRNRRGIVGGRVARGNSNREEISVA